MTKLFSFVVAGVTLAAPALAAPATVNDLANMRSGPGAHYPVVTVLPAGSVVDAGARVGGWRRVSARGATGYVASSLLAPGALAAAPRVYVAPPVYPRPYCDPYDDIGCGYGAGFYPGWGLGWGYASRPWGWRHHRWGGGWPHPRPMISGGFGPRPMAAPVGGFGARPMAGFGARAMGGGRRR